MTLKGGGVEKQWNGYKINIEKKTYFDILMSTYNLQVGFFPKGFVQESPSEEL